MPRAAFRFVPNPRMFDEIASSPEMHATLLAKAQEGAAILGGIAPSYSGPTYKPGVTRRGEYKARIFAEAHLNPNGWRSQFGSDADWTLQVEFGTGRTQSRARDARGRFRSTRHRPQGGHSPKSRPLGRTLDALRSTA